MQKVPITLQGAEKLRVELEQLLRVERRQISKAIGEARAHGDLSENAEYHAAKEQQGLVEARIRVIEHKLANAQIVDVTKLHNVDKVVFGATVHLVNIDTDEKVRYQIVGDDEADFKVGKISYASPIARALIGRHEGALIEVNTPGGQIEYELMKIEYV